MLYVLRLTNGNCIVLLASDEPSARSRAQQMDFFEQAEVASVRQIENFAVQLSPTEDGSLEIVDWDEGALDSILVNEYPVLQEAYREANARPFAKAAPDQPVIVRLNAEFERNTEAMRDALRIERQRFMPKADGAHS